MLIRDRYREGLWIALIATAIGGSAVVVVFFFFNDPAPTEIYTVMNTLSLHDALPISRLARRLLGRHTRRTGSARYARRRAARDRKSTRLNSSHSSPSRMPSSA